MIGFRLNVNSYCNLRCKHCYYLSKVGFDGEEMSLDNAINIVDQAYSIYGKDLQIIIMGGGEPMQYPYLFDLLEYISSNGIDVSIVTNGTLITDNHIKEFKRLNVRLDISVEGKEEYNDNIRGKGVFKKVSKLVLDASRAGVDIILNMTINKSNLSHVLYIKKLFSPYVNMITFSRYIPYLKNKYMKELSEKEYILLDKILKEGDKFKSRQEPFLRIDKNNLRDDYAFNILNIRSLYVLPNMDIFPSWNLIDYKLGNLGKDSLSDILNNGKLEKLFNPNNLRGNKCSKCKYKYNCAGDRGVAFFYTGDFWGDDIQCPFYT